MKTVIALKMRLTGRIPVMIPIDQVSVILFDGDIGRLSFPVNPYILYLSLGHIW